MPAAARVWRANQLDRETPADAVRSTGHAALDAELPGGGWPAAGLTELLLPAHGVGELRLLAPALAGLALLWVAPPCVPYAPALAALGLAPERLTVATVEDAPDAAWAAEQALRAGVLGAVLWWQRAVARDRAGAWSATLRRLHLAAEAGRTPLFALRPMAERAQSSPAPLRLALAAAGPSRLAVEVFKRRGPPMATPLVLELPAPLRRRRAGPAAHPADAARASRPDDHAVVRLAPERVAA
ncbi:MAG TPA: translesion DNA synthesis-associated protein ImuA [Burkholderiaceae bacterium]|nr:translesion DNA synthesis-associated protein ImuA [Burkholderiaceae bacterium]